MILKLGHTTIPEIWQDAASLLPATISGLLAITVPQDLLSPCTLWQYRETCQVVAIDNHSGYIDVTFSIHGCMAVQLTTVKSTRDDMYNMLTLSI